MPHFASGMWNIPDGIATTGVKDTIAATANTAIASYTIADIPGYASTPHAGWYLVLVEAVVRTAVATATVTVKIKTTNQSNAFDETVLSAVDMNATAGTIYRFAGWYYCDNATAIQSTLTVANAPKGDVRIRVIDLAVI